jgi:hypothetical protein
MWDRGKGITEVTYGNLKSIFRDENGLEKLVEVFSEAG